MENGKDPFPMLTIEAADVGRYPDLLARIHSRELFGALIRNVFDPSEVAGVLDAIRQDRHDVDRFESDTFDGCSFGRVLRMSSEDLTEYFRAAARLRSALPKLFAGSKHYEPRLREVLGAMASGRPVEVPVSASGQAYAPATIRLLNPGGTIFLHCGNETHQFPSLAELKHLIDPGGETSCVIPLSPPEAGGELVIYAVGHGHPAIREIDAGVGRLRAHEVLREFPHIRLDPGVGDLLLFDEGRHYHRVAEVRGERPRITMGGFLAPSVDSKTIYYWS